MLGCPKVSILIPVYNRAHLIRDTLQSALVQTYRDFEVVVCDNASTDDTWSVLQEFSGDERVRLFRNEENLGPVRNWRRCLDEARGDYAKLLFSDDLLSPQFLQRTVPILASDPEIGFVFTATRLGEAPAAASVCHEWVGVPQVAASRRFIIDALTKRNLPVSPGSALFRTLSLRKNLMDEVPSPTLTGFWKTGAGPDLLCYLLTANDHPKIAHLVEPLCFFRDHVGSISVGSEGRLTAYYGQARIWFAEKYTDEKLFSRTRIQVWAAFCRQERRLLPYSSLMKRFLVGSVNMSFMERLLIVGISLRLLKRHVKSVFIKN